MLRALELWQEVIELCNSTINYDFSQWETREFLSQHAARCTIPKVREDVFDKLHDQIEL
jgi:hypothetical protein